MAHWRGGEHQYYYIRPRPMPIFGYVPCIHLSFKFSDWKPQILRSVQRRNIAERGGGSVGGVGGDMLDHRFIPVLSDWIRIDGTLNLSLPGRTY